jgi:hydroxyacylglutathione hydrolase
VEFRTRKLEPSVKITDRIHLVGSGRNGLSLTDGIDCHVYLIDGGSECALVDAGGGRDTAGIARHIQADGFDLGRMKRLFLTHAHGDHAAGAAALRERLGVKVLASREIATAVRAGDERFASLDVARKAGIYPTDFTLAPCEVDEELRHGDAIPVGDLEVSVVAAEGHSRGHLAYVVSHAGMKSLFCGDAFFFGGRILLQHTWDCSVQESIATVERLAVLDVEGLYPGHGTFCVRQGRRQFEPALRSIAALLPPAQLA